MENIVTFFKNLINNPIVNSIIIVVISLLIYKFILLIINKGDERNKFKTLSDRKRKTYVKLSKSIIRYVFVIVTILILLQVNGIDVSSVLAGVGILGAVFGLALQDWIKDVIRGSSIISDNYFVVGDIVKYKNIEGKVLVIGIKTTKIQELKTGNILSIANRNIEEIETVSDKVYIDIPMPYEIEVVKAEKIIDDIIQVVKQNSYVEDCRYCGVNEFGDSEVKYLIEVKGNPINKLQMRRDALTIILSEMNIHGINVPYKQIDIHQK